MICLCRRGWSGSPSRKRHQRTNMLFLSVSIAAIGNPGGGIHD